MRKNNKPMIFLRTVFSCVHNHQISRWRQYGLRIPYFILCLLLLVSAGHATAFHDQDCPGILLNEHGKLDEDYILVCAGLQKAVDFFQGYGIPTRHLINVMVHDAAIENHVDHIGTYEPEHKRVDILSYEQARRRSEINPPFGEAMNEQMYVSFSAHEFAHAIAEQNFTYDSHSYVVQEYIAYVVQLATMDATLRDQILKRYRVTAFESFDDVSLIYYQLDPNAFGVKSFRHFRLQDDPATFINKLLAGEILPANSQGEWW
jgi:hypothetical protein